MAPGSGQPSHALTEITRYAIGTRNHARALVHAHGIGVEPGELRPWNPEFLRASVKIWLETCPESYVAQIGQAVSTYASLMNAEELIEGPCDDWALVLAQAEGIVTAIDEQLGERVPKAKKVPPRTDSVPGVIRYDKLAARSTKNGALRLQAAGARVADYCRRRARGDLSSTEIEWLRALARGERTAEIADRAGHSERDFYRVLRRLWARIGVASRGEAIGLASQMGWLDEDL